MTLDSTSGADSGDAKDGLVDRAERLFLYLRELALLRTRTIRDVADYDQVVWLADLPAGTPATTAFDSEDDGESLTSWLEVDRVQLPEFPDPAAELSVWLDRPAMRRYDLDEPPLVEFVEGLYALVAIQIARKLDYDGVLPDFLESGGEMSLFCHQVPF